MKKEKEYKLSNQEHKQFLQDCKDMKLYLNYKKQIFKHAVSYNEDELFYYHMCYITLVSSWVNYNGSFLNKQIKSILDSAKTAEEKYNEYKSCLDEQIILYNKVHTINKSKQIKLI